MQLSTIAFDCCIWLLLLTIALDRCLLLLLLMQLLTVALWQNGHVRTQHINELGCTHFRAAVAAPFAFSQPSASVKYCRRQIGLVSIQSIEVSRATEIIRMFVVYEAKVSCATENSGAGNLQGWVALCVGSKKILAVRGKTSTSQRSSWLHKH